MTAKIYQFSPRTEEPEVLGDGPHATDGDGGGPDVIEIHIVLEAPDLADESEEHEAIEEPKQRTWPAFVYGALLGWWLGG